MFRQEVKASVKKTKLALPKFCFREFLYAKKRSDYLLLCPT